MPRVKESTSEEPRLTEEDSGTSQTTGLQDESALNEPELRDAESPGDGVSRTTEAYDEGTETEADVQGEAPGVEPVSGYAPVSEFAIAPTAGGDEAAAAERDFAEAVDADFASDESGQQEFLGALVSALPMIIQGGRTLSRLPFVRRAGRTVLRRFGLESEGVGGDGETSSLLEVVIGVDDRVRITNTSAKPWSGICQLNITSRTGRKFIGTGWLIAPRVAITAGHCVYLHGAGGWASSIEVSAGRNGTSYPFGRVSTSRLRALTQWTRDRSRNYDYGCIILPSAPRGAAGLPFCFNFAALSDAEIRRRALNLSGYPGDKGGTTQWFHARSAKSVSGYTISYDIDTGGGQSGSPVWHYNSGVRTAVGIHTNGSPLGNSATRITPAVAGMLRRWKALGT